MTFFSSARGELKKTLENACLMCIFGVFVFALNFPGPILILSCFYLYLIYKDDDFRRHPLTETLGVVAFHVTSFLCGIVIELLAKKYGFNMGVKNMFLSAIMFEFKPYRFYSSYLVASPWSFIFMFYGASLEIIAIVQLMKISVIWFLDKFWGSKGYVHHYEPEQIYHAPRQSLEHEQPRSQSYDPVIYEVEDTVASSSQERRHSDPPASVRPKRTRSNHPGPQLTIQVSRPQSTTHAKH